MEIKLTAEDLAKKKLFVATPMYAGQNYGIYCKSMCDLSAICTRYGIELQYFALFNESLVTRCRNYCTDEFLRSKMDYMLFIDSDIGFDPGDIIAMLGMMTPESPYDVLCAPYPKKCLSWEKIVQAVNKGVADNDPNVLDKYVGDYVFNPKSGQSQIPINEPCEILEGGTGFMMIRRPTLEKFQKAFPHYMYRPDHVRTQHFDGSRQICQFFQAEIDAPDAVLLKERIKKILNNNGTIEEVKKEVDDFEKKLSTASNRYLSEDYWFSQKIQELGMKIWLCPWMKLTHTGTHIFGGSLADLASIGASPTAEVSLLKKDKQKQ